MLSYEEKPIFVCVSVSWKLNDYRWNFSVGQHDVSFVARKSAECESSTHSQRHDRIAAQSSDHVDDSCRKASANSVKYRVVLDTEEDDGFADQCKVQSQCL